MELPSSLRARDVSKYLNVSTRYAYEIMKREDFPLLEFGRAKRVLKEDFLEWVEKQKKAG